MKLTRALVVPLVLVALGLAGCGGKDPDGTFRVTLLCDDQMKFDKKVIEVPAGAEIALTLEHTGRIAVDVMGHNFVLLEQGTDLDTFAMAAASAKKTGYIPPRKRDEVIAHTRMLGGGDSDTIVFAAPPAGTYEFICSFPGHYLKMRGDFIVR